jgi:hypothetical protein
MKILKIIKRDYRGRRIIRELYKHQTTSIKIKESKEKRQLEKERSNDATYRHFYLIYTKKKL